jgi:hypothetical protein
MSDTPRTDREALMAEDVTSTDYVVPADFSRQLERELTVAQAKLALLSVAQDCGAAITENAENYLRAAVAGIGVGPAPKQK